MRRRRQRQISNAFGNVVFTNGGVFGGTFTRAPATTCTTSDICASPLTYFLVSPVAQTLTISAMLDNAGAVYLDGTLVTAYPSANPITVTVNVPQGPFALSFMACSNDGPSLQLAVYDAFLTNANYKLSVDYDRTFHRNGK